MYVLNGQTLARRDWFMPEGMPLQLQDSAISTASVTVGPEAPEISVGDWLLDDSGGPGGGIVWRVKGVETNYSTETRTATLEHVLATLQDGILSGEHTAKAMGGRDTCTARQALEYALRGQGVWVLGDCEYDRSLPYVFNNTTRYQAIVTVCGTLSDWRWEYDLTRLPFVLHVRRQSADVGSELRMGRNLTTLKVTVDRSQMYTRFYPVGARNRMLPERYVDKNTAVYGVIEHTATDQSMTSDAMMRAWAEELLSKHAEPNVSVAVSALELSAATGEPLDNIRLGMVCRVPLPKYGTTIRERVTRLQWADCLRDPVSVSVTLANSQTDVASIIRQVASGGSRNAGGAAAAQEEDHAWIVDTTDHVGLVAEAIVGRDGETVDWSRVSSIIVDGEGIHQRVVKAEGEIVTAQTAIEMNEEAIQLEAQRATEAEGTLSSRITVEAGRITSEVTRATESEGALSSRITQTATQVTSLVEKTGVDELGKNDTLYSRITQEAARITSEVTRATESEGTLSSRITQTAGQITTLIEKTGVDDLGRNETLYSRITQEAGRITSEVTRATNAESTLRSRVTQTEDRIALVVTQSEGEDVLDAAAIVAGINNQTGSYVKIKAKTINLDGYVTATELSATNATITNLETGKTKATKLSSTLIVTDRINIGGYATSWQKINYVASVSITLPSLSYSDGHYFLYAGSSQSATPSGSANGRVVTGWSGGSVSVSAGNAYFLVADHEDN